MEKKKAPQVLVLFSACNNHHRDFDESVSSFSQMHCNESLFPQFRDMIENL